MEKNAQGWHVIADSKKVGQFGWLPQYNKELQKYRGLSDAATHWVVTKKIKRKK